MAVLARDPIEALLGEGVDLIALEGLHALKHASRFGASIVAIFTSDLVGCLGLAASIAPDLVGTLQRAAQQVPSEVFRKYSARSIHTKVLAFAHRPAADRSAAMPRSGRPTIVLDDPRNLGNLGASIRVAAATKAAGILTIGVADPFGPMAVRGAAGLQFAIPTLGLKVWPDTLNDNFVLAFDADGDRFDPAAMDTPVTFVFGSERSGLSAEIRDRADALVSLPMTPGVSSLNLATTVSAVMYLYRYAWPSKPEE